MLENNIKEKLNGCKCGIESIMEELENFENDKTSDNFLSLTLMFDKVFNERVKEELRMSVYNLEFEIEED